jgi:hypothetical protein
MTRDETVSLALILGLWPLGLCVVLAVHWIAGVVWR